MTLKFDDAIVGRWTKNYKAEPYKGLYLLKGGSCQSSKIGTITLEKKAIDNPESKWGWFPLFSGDIELLNDIYKDKKGNFIIGTEDFAQHEVDSFLDIYIPRIQKLKNFL
jgi:hypothetical protein